MIEALKKYAGSYRLGSIKPTEGREGPGWIGLIYMDGRLIGDAADFGNGGMTRIRIEKKEDMDALVAHAKTVNFANLQYEIEGMFLEELANYELSIKKLKARAKKCLMQSDETVLDRNGVAQSYSEWKCADTPENRKAILSRNPDIKFLNDELAQWEPVKAKK